jgi:3-methyladenine DNA glycosylase AlkD
MTHSKYIKEVEESLSRLSHKPSAQTEKLRRYIGTNLAVSGLTAPEQKALFKKGFSFYTDDREHTFRILDSVYQAGKTFEAKNLAFSYLELHYKHISPQLQLELLPGWVKHVDNWAHSDGLSKFLTRLLEHEATRRHMMKILIQWNGSLNPWERRQSLVALFYYARTKQVQVPFNTGTRFLKPLLGDEHYFVQKAVGWTLRECYNVYPKETFDFIARHYKQVTSIAFTAAIEKMSDKEKGTLKSLRKSRA